MADDILDAAQKAINDAAKAADTPPTDSGASPVSSNPVVASPASSLPPEPAPEPIANTPAPVMEPVPTVVPSPPAPSDAPASPEPSKDASQVMDNILDTGSGATVVPPANQPPHTGKPLPKKSGFKGPILAIIALLLLTIPVAVYYISKQNEQIADTRSSAYEACASAGECINQSTNNTCCSGTVSKNDSSCGTVPVRCVAEPTGIPGGGGCTIGQNGEDPCADGYSCHCKNGNICDSGVCEETSLTETSCGNQTREWCINGFTKIAYTCCEPGYSCGPNNTGCIKTGGGGGGGGGDNPTPTTGNTPVCQNIKVYKGGTQVTNLTTLRPGDEVVLAVKGNLSPSKARFRVNGADWSETTTKNSSDEYTQAYTIPEGVTQFQIEGEVFTNGAWR